VDTIDYCQLVLHEIHHVIQQVNQADSEELIQAIRTAPRIYLAGMGRGGLSVKAFAMRLMHLGFETYVVGETNTPRLRSGDLMLIGSGSGETGTLVHLGQKAKEAGARLAIITATPQSTLASKADVMIHLPAKNIGGDQPVTRQPMAALYEQSLLVFSDALVLRLMETLPVNEAQMIARHTNLE
jgi:6-phospho-3-hexuloisomerase